MKPATPPPSGAVAPSAPWPCRPPMRVAETRNVPGPLIGLVQRAHQRVEALDAPAVQLAERGEVELGERRLDVERRQPEHALDRPLGSASAPRRLATSSVGRAPSTARTPTPSAPGARQPGATPPSSPTTTTRVPWPSDTPVGLHDVERRPQRTARARGAAPGRRPRVALRTRDTVGARAPRLGASLSRRGAACQDPPHCHPGSFGWPARRGIRPSSPPARAGFRSGRWS